MYTVAHSIGISVTPIVRQLFVDPDFFYTLKITIAKTCFIEYLYDLNVYTY